ncbi:MAG: cytochrome c [Burkholderiaceae bacterium]
MPQDLEQLDAQKREMPEPYESYRPVPKLVIVIVAGVFLWAIGYILLSRPGQDPALGDSRTTAALMAHTAVAGGAVDGAQIYAAQCIACHQATGAGLPGVFPPLAKSEWVNGKEELVAKILLHGITGSLTVAGATYNGAMPAFGEKLSDAEIAAVLTHVRSNFGNSAGKVDEAVVKAARAARAAQKTPWNGDADLAALK